MEIKVGVIHTGSERCGATRTRLTDRRYAATTAGVTSFGARVTAALTAVDRWHLRDARRRATRAAIPDKAIRQPWSVQLEEAFDSGAVASALGVQTEMMQRYPHPALGEFAGYVRNHVGRIPDYAARRAAGRGMRWWRERASGVIALRLAILNDEWEQRVCDAHAA